MDTSPVEPYSRERGNPPNQMLADFEKKGIDIVVVDQLGFRSTPEFLVPAVNAHINRFELLHVVPDPDTYILEFK